MSCAHSILLAAMVHEPSDDGRNARKSGSVLERSVAVPGLLSPLFRARVERHAREAIAERRTFTMAVPGGSVADAFFPSLVEADVAWSRVTVCWCDERAVPSESSDSNWSVAWRLWLRHLPPQSRPRTCRMPADTAPLELAAERHERDLNAVLSGSGGAIDLALLGLGTDGHIASLFSGAAALAAHDGPAVVAVRGAPKSPPDRLSLTLPTLVRARVVVLAALGLEKARIVKEVVENPLSEVPAALLIRRRATSLMLLDDQAASLLA